MLLKKFISMDRDTKNKQISCDSWWLIESVVPYVRYNQKKKKQKNPVLFLSTLCKPLLWRGKMVLVKSIR